jgi:hypothetical protein
MPLCKVAWAQALHIVGNDREINQNHLQRMKKPQWKIVMKSRPPPTTNHSGSSLIRISIARSGARGKDLDVVQQGITLPLAVGFEAIEQPRQANDQIASFRNHVDQSTVNVPQIRAFQ